MYSSLFLQNFSILQKIAEFIGNIGVSGSCQVLCITYLFQGTLRRRPECQGDGASKRCFRNSSFEIRWRQLGLNLGLLEYGGRSLRSHPCMVNRGGNHFESK